MNLDHVADRWVRQARELKRGARYDITWEGPVVEERVEGPYARQLDDIGASISPSYDQRVSVWPGWAPLVVDVVSRMRQTPAEVQIMTIQQKLGELRIHWGTPMPECCQNWLQKNPATEHGTASLGHRHAAADPYPGHTSRDHERSRALSVLGELTERVSGFVCEWTGGPGWPMTWAAGAA